MRGWLTTPRRRKEDTLNAITPTTHLLPAMNEVQRNDPTVRALTSGSDGKPLPAIPKSARGAR